MKVVFKEPALTAYRRARNIADICVHTKHGRQFNRKTPGCFKCSKKCAMCPYMSENDSFHGLDGSSYQMARKVTCDSRNVIYCISCTECSTPIYVGETGDRVYARMQNHLSRIRTRNTADPVGHHFTCNKTFDRKLQIHSNRKSQRKQLFLQDSPGIILDEEVKDNGIAWN